MVLGLGMAITVAPLTTTAGFFSLPDLRPFVLASFVLFFLLGFFQALLGLIALLGVDAEHGGGQRLVKMITNVEVPPGKISGRL